MGVRSLYSEYSFPKRFISSGSSIYLNSRMLINTNSGVMMKVSDIDPNKMPIPAITINKPVIIGFLE